MERHIHTHTDFFSLYNPVKLYAVNKAVAFEPYLSGLLKLDAVSVTEAHRSVRQRKGDIRQ